MKNCSEEYRKTRETLPLEGGGKGQGQEALNLTWFRGGGERTDRHSKKLRKHCLIFSNLEGVLEIIRGALLTPHPAPLPCLRRSGFAQAGPRGEGR